MNEDYSFIIENFEWSFSRINSFSTCPYGWLKQYVLNEERESGYYGEYGSYIHKILEMYFKGELEIYELASYYEEHYYENVVSLPPPKPIDLAERYYEEGKAFLENFDFPHDKYEILGVEKEVKFNIDGFNFLGYIDLLLKDKTNNEVIIVDYKSSDPYKKGKTPDKGKIEEYKKQQYLYAYGIHNEFGFYPSKLVLWFFRLDKQYKIEFNEEECKKSTEWAINEINKIMKETEFKPLSSYWYCSYLCSVRNSCEFKVTNKGQ